MEAPQLLLRHTAPLSRTNLQARAVLEASRPKPQDWDHVRAAGASTGGGFCSFSQ